jgi:hypothetical protein
MTCAELEDLAAELALGGVSGAERAAAVTHLAQCDSCRTLVDQLSRAADNLLFLAPSAEPPPGFESRVLSRIAAASQPIPLRPHRRRQRQRLWLGAAALALVAAMSGAGVADLRHHDTYSGPIALAPAPSGVRTALVADAAGRWTCRVVVYGDKPTWLVVSLDRSDGSNAAFSVEAVPMGDGAAAPVPVGGFAITGGHGSLATTVALPPGQFQSVRVLDDTGHVKYEAVFQQQA